MAHRATRRSLETWATGRRPESAEVDALLSRDWPRIAGRRGRDRGPAGPRPTRRPRRSRRPAATGAAAARSNAEAPIACCASRAENLNRLLGLAGESLVESRWVKPFAESLLRLKRLQQDSRQGARQSARCAVGAGAGRAGADRAGRRAARVLECQQFLAAAAGTSSRHSIAGRPTSRTGSTTRRSPAACGRSPTASRGFRAWCATSAARSASRCGWRSSARRPQVDRDILAKLDAPLGHLLRNAVDHGIESPEERRAAGKPAEGVVRLEARHSAGALQIIVSDDGRGIDLDQLRQAVVERELIDGETAARRSAKPSCSSSCSCPASR